MKKTLFAMLFLVCVAAFGYSASNADPPTHSYNIECIAFHNLDAAPLAETPMFVTQCQTTVIFIESEMPTTLFVCVPEVTLVFEPVCVLRYVTTTVYNSMQNCEVEVQLKYLNSFNCSDALNKSNDNRIAYSMASIQ